MATAGRYSFVIEKGASFLRTVTWYTDDAATVPQNLTGYTARMKVKTKDLSSVILDSAAGDITLTLGGAAGTVEVGVAAAKTTTLAPTSVDGLAYDLELVDGSGFVTRLLQGGVTVSAEVTA